MRKLLILTVIAAFVTGCDSKFFDNAKHKAVREGLKDPDSAKWISELVHEDRACIVFNAKNSFGGYIGKQTAWLQNSDRTDSAWGLKDINEKICEEAALKDWAQKDMEEQEFEEKLVSTLNDKGLSNTKVSRLVFIPSTNDNDCVKLARTVMTSYRLSRENRGVEKNKWEEKMREELAQLEAGECHH